MGNIKGQHQFPEQVYLWEETDPVQGGDEGIDNVPIKQLANRTQYLGDLSLKLFKDVFDKEPLGSFGLGFTLSNPDQVVYDESSGTWYKWIGNVPKVVAPGKTPANSGGIYDAVTNPTGLWSVFKSNISEELSKNTAASNIFTQSGKSVQSELNKVIILNSISELRSVSPEYDGQIFKVSYHTSPGYGGGGLFYYDASDSTSPDDNGWCIVSGSSRLKRLNTRGSFNLVDFGLIDGASIDDPLDNAIKSLTTFGGSEIVIPPTKVYSMGYTLDREHVVDDGLMPFNLVGDRDKAGEGVPIKQTVNGVGIWFKNITRTLFSSGSVSGFRFSFTGSSSTSARAVRVSDSWGFRIFNCFFRDYKSTRPIQFLNYDGWTENPHVISCISRNCKGLVDFSRRSSADSPTVTGSFFGTQIIDSWCQAGVAGTTPISVGDGTLAVKLYGSRIEIGGWLESGGGHNFIVVEDYSELSDTEIVMTSDGLSGSTGSDLCQIVKKGLNGFVDVRVVQKGQQGSEIDISSVASGTKLGHPWIIAKNSTNPTQLNNNGKISVKASGSRLRFKHSNSTEDKVLTLWRLQPASLYRIKMYVGSGYDALAQSFLVTTRGSNLIAYVCPEGTVGNTAISDNLKVRTYNNLAGGSTSVDNGLSVDLIINGASSSSITGRTVYIELEIL